MRLLLLFLGLSLLLPAATLRGKLVQQVGQPPAIESGGQKTLLEGDEPTLKVLNDERLKDTDFEVVGHADGAGKFAVDPIHLRALFFYHHGKRVQVSYWCDVCYIRTSSPGKCWCCQKYTDLDPIEPEQ